MQLHSIQCLRAVAVTLVVYMHSIELQKQFSVSWQQNFYHLHKFGAVGVDLFFIISGFIISYVANNYLGARQGLRFLAKRFFRINPLYYVASLLFWGILIIQSWITHKSDVQFTGLGKSFFDTLFILPISGDLRSYSPLLTVGWTLSFEWLFYIIFFLLILFRIRDKAMGLVVIITFLVAAGYILKFNFFQLVFITNPILLEFLLGVMIYWIYSNIKDNPVYIAVACVLTGLISYGFFIVYEFGNVLGMYNVLDGQSSMARFIVWGIPSGFLAAGCIFLEKNSKLNRFWNNKWIRLTGDASYSIYLVHPGVFVLVELLYRQTGFFIHADLAIFLQLFIASGLGIVFYKIVEKPLLHAVKRIAVKKTRASLVVH